MAGIGVSGSYKGGMPQPINHWATFWNDEVF
jgi:hypothetical protein